MRIRTGLRSSLSQVVFVVSAICTYISWRVSCCPVQTFSNISMLCSQKVSEEITGRSQVHDTVDQETRGA